MSKYRFKNNKNFCYSVCEETEKGFIKKIQELNKEKKAIIELRLDYLLSAGFSIENISKLIKKIHDRYSSKKIIATIRTNDEGGRVDLSREKYYYFIRTLYNTKGISYIDIEYKYYKADKQYYDLLFKKKKKKIILSMHLFDKILSELDYINTLNELISAKSGIVKFATNTFTKENLFSFMLSSRKFSLKYKRKDFVFIAMGEIGLLSRVWPEFTNTKLVYLNAYDNDINKIGAIKKEDFVKYRKNLAKM